MVEREGRGGEEVENNYGARDDHDGEKRRNGVEGNKGDGPGKK